MDYWVTNTSQFFSYYPKYEFLDNVLSLTKRKKINLYVDVKGCGQALFQEWAVKYILENSIESRIADTSVFSSVLEFISFHKLYAKKRECDINFYFFMDSGQSSYHSDIYNKYKEARKSSDFFGLDVESRKLFYKILDKNYYVLDRVVNKLPNCSFIRLEFLESDFVPWYLMKYCLSKDEIDSSTNIVYSIDKDMLQCLDGPNKFQFYRHYKNVKMLTYKDIFKQGIKSDIESNDPASWFPLALSIIGDVSDCYAGVKGVGPGRIKKCFAECMKMCGSMDCVYDNIYKNQPIFDKNLKVKDASLQLIIDNHDLIVRNLKLASFELLSREMNSGFPLHMTKMKKIITESINNKEKCSSANVLLNALNSNGLMGILKESTVSQLF